MPVQVAPIVATALMTGGLFGKKRGGGDAALQAALREFSQLQAPTVEQMKVKLEELVQQGVIEPAQAEAILLDGSAFEDISTDPRIRGAQMQALLGLQEVASDGITPIEKAAMREIQDNLETTSRGDQLAIMENRKARGLYGSGDEYAQRMLASQMAATRASREGLQTAADARKRSLEALMQTGQLSGQIRGQDYDQAARKAAALDEIRRFNTSNRQAVVNANVDRRNAATAVNLQEKQRVADANINNRNQNRVRDADLVQRDFENKMNIARGKSGQLTSMAQLDEERRRGDEAYRAALLGAGGQILSTWKP